jgi:carbonic anhydrase
MILSEKSGSSSAVMTKELQSSMTPLEILQAFKDGNKRFVENRMIQKNYRHQMELTSKEQHPYAIVLGCIDSRKPTEIIFDKGIGDIFIARIAGNFANTDIIGSMEYACKLGGAKMILVLGHTDCGAIKGACDDIKLGNLTSLLENIKPAVEAVKGFEGKRNPSSPEFVNAVAKANIFLTMEKIKKQSPILNEMMAQGHILMVGCMYHLGTGVVEFYE